MQVWSATGTSPSKPVCPLHASPSCFCREGTFPVPPPHLCSSDCSENTRAKHPLSLVCSQSEVDKLKISFFFFFFPLLLCDFLASSPLCVRKRKRKDELHPVLLLVSITVHTRIPVELLHVQVILPSTLAAGLSQSCGC